MKQIRAWAVCVSLSLVSPLAIAVELGYPNVSSYLNEPLKASMPLLGNSDYPLEDISVRVANQAEFAAAGLEWEPFAANVIAQVQERQGRRQVYLSSQQTMKEPWLELLLTLQYPGGSHTRDVTLLFDPQDYAQREAVNNLPSDGPPRLYINRGDTLWSVAELTKPVNASVQQMMAALVDANPNVFPSGNANEMRAGQTLRVPNEELVMARSGVDMPNAPADSIQSLQTSETDLSSGAANAHALRVGQPAPIEEDIEPPDALFPAGLAEQLRLNQAVLQQMRDERGLMRTELSELRSDIASLAEALSDLLSSQAVAADQSPVRPAASTREGQRANTFIADYQWPLGLTAIVLLGVLLIWRRKHQDETWNDAAMAEATIKPAVSPTLTPGPDSMAGVPASQQKVDDDRNRRPLGEHEKGESPENSDHWLVDYHPPNEQFASQRVTDAETPANRAPGSIEASWEIEEVAFKPVDNR
ncbi:MAG: type IV pilus assembly protein FimV [Halomonas sp.]|uniref:type IV pilus assembly protein FimV n=1 Tax=Halomonas sp. TaxID=1486246 RepID=UPI003F8FC6C6